MKSWLGYRNGRACQAQAPLRLAAPARAGRGDAARHPRRRPAAVRARRATPPRRWRRSPPRPASRSRPSTWRSRPRAACCARSGTSCCAATATTSRWRSSSWYREVLDGARPRAAAAPQRAQSRVVVKQRIGGVLEVIRSAAAVDPDIGELWARIQAEFHANQRAIVESLAAKGALAPGSTSTRAADILWTLNHPNLWQLLVGERGWTPDAVRALVRRDRLRAAARLGQARRLGPRRAQPVGVQAHAVAVLDDRRGWRWPAGRGCGRPRR